MVKKTDIRERTTRPGDEAELGLRSHVVISVPPRLLNQSDAASYCAMSVPMFKRECPVRPLRFGKRDIRYVRTEIDKWIDAKSAPCSIGSSKDWLRLLDDAHED